MTEKEYENGGFRTVNADFFSEKDFGDDGAALCASILRDITNSRSVKSSNSIAVQLGRIEQIRGAMAILEKHCKDVEKTLMEVRRNKEGSK